MKRKQGATEWSRVSFAGKAAGRYLSVFLCLFLIAGMLKTTSFFSLATSSRELENRQRKLQNQMEQNRAGITNANQSQEDARQEQGELNEAIGETDRELSEVVANVGLIQKEIDKKQSSIIRRDEGAHPFSLRAGRYAVCTDPVGSAEFLGYGE